MTGLYTQRYLQIKTRNRSSFEEVNSHRGAAEHSFYAFASAHICISFSEIGGKCLVTDYPMRCDFLPALS